MTVLIFPSYLGFVKYFQSNFGLSDQFLYMMLISVSHILVYSAINGFFVLVDLDKYKFERNKAQIPGATLINSTLVAAVISQLITSPLLTYYLYPAFQSLGLKALDAPLPPLRDLAWTYFVAHAFNDFGFYWTHRMLHTKLLYSTVHKQHHEFKGSIGIAAEYAHPIESLVSNILPSIGGVTFFGCHHPICLIIWISMRLYQTYFAHSGLALCGTFLEKIGFAHVESACFHDHHHTVNKGNYGGMVTDYMFGTMDDYAAGGLAKGYISRHINAKNG